MNFEPIQKLNLEHKFNYKPNYSYVYKPNYKQIYKISEEKSLQLWDR